MDPPKPSSSPDWSNAFAFEPSSTSTTKEKPAQPAAVHKSRYKSNSISKSADEARLKRIELDAEVRRKHREQLITAKRFKHQSESLITDEEESEFDLTQNDIKKLQSNLESHTRDIRLQALKDLSKYLVDPPETLKQLIIEGDCVKILTRFLTGTDPEEQLQAISCVTNIAAGPKNICEAALQTVPYLISFLDVDDLVLQNQATWAIGNFAAEGSEYRDLLRANGVLIPLVRLLDSKDVNLIQTVCFALSNLARGPDPKLDEFFKIETDKVLLRHLENDEMSEVVSEISWVLAYLTSDSDTYTSRLLSEGLIPRLVKHMRPLLSHGPLALPLIRTLGNVAGGPDENADELIQQEEFLKLMIEYVQSECRAVKKESLWVMSNITAARRSEVLAKVISVGFIPILSTIATHTNFDIRKEAAYGLLNIASHGEEYLQSLPHQDLLPGFLEFVRSQDTDLIRLGLTYIHLLITQVPSSRQLLESLNAIDAVESVTLSEDQDLKTNASRLMDLYFGENFVEMEGMDEANEPNEEGDVNGQLVEKVDV
ncbi:181_t:CDS:10 [Paraglomus occultum]|uniref:Importin subunit alpha n=1 Tax=Paraglomus occultum TaxID=144539 RepID=A0A9N8ZKD6_9GLOM|nr:181_t:CDS:10 [Paraglomus occultum]